MKTVEEELNGITTSALSKISTKKLLRLLESSCRKTSMISDRNKLDELCQTIDDVRDELRRRLDKNGSKISLDDIQNGLVFLTRSMAMLNDGLNDRNSQDFVKGLRGVPNLALINTLISISSSKVIGGISIQVWIAEQITEEILRRCQKERK